MSIFQFYVRFCRLPCRWADDACNAHLSILCQILAYMEYNAIVRASISLSILCQILRSSVVPSSELAILLSILCQILMGIGYASTPLIISSGLSILCQILTDTLGISSDMSSSPASLSILC